MTTWQVLEVSSFHDTMHHDISSCMMNIISCMTIKW